MRFCPPPQPLVICTTSRKVDVLWVTNSQAAQWEGALPAETQQLLADARAGAPGLPAHLQELRQYPYISTFDADYTPVRAKQRGEAGLGTAGMPARAARARLRSRSSLEALAPGASPGVDPVEARRTRGCGCVAFVLLADCSAVAAGVLAQHPNSPV
jgi:hypothetical protein